MKYLGAVSVSVRLAIEDPFPLSIGSIDVGGMTTVGHSRPSFRFQELANRSSLCTERTGISQPDRSRPQCSDQRIARQGNAGVAQGRFGPDKIVCVGRHADRCCNFDQRAGRTFGTGEIAG